MKKTGIILLYIFCAITAYAQAPQIINIEKTSTWPSDTLVIVGNNFSTNTGNLEVYFGPVRGDIINSTNTTIEVVVPARAHFEAVRVLNLTTNLYGYSTKKFFPSYSGSTFDETKFSAPIEFEALQGQGEFYDVCSCDLNRDGKTDIVATKFSGATDITILKNNSTPGNLSFTRLDQTQVFTLNVNTQTLNITCTDVNGDGKPEILASRFTGGGGARNEVYVLRNTSTTSTISFASKVSLVMPGSVQSRGVTAVDIDGDGKPEIVVADSASDEIYIFKNNSSTSNVSFVSTPVAITLPGAIGYNKIDYQDMNADGLQDLIISPFIDNNLYVLLNSSSTGNFAFEVREVTSGSNNFIRVKAGDLNNDGLPDLVGTSNIENEVRVYKNIGNANFDPPIVLAGEEGTWGLDMADMNGDGYLDIITGNNSSPVLNVFINTNGTPELSFDKNSVPINLSSRNLVAGDFDGDAKPDIVFTATGGGQNPPYKLEILRNLNCFEPEILNIEPASICPGQTFQLRSIPNPNTTFTWFKNGTEVKTGTENFLDINYEPSATYKVQALSEGGTCVLSDEITVDDGTGTVPGDPQPQVLNSPVCEDENIELTVQDLAGATYMWRGPNGFTSNVREPVIPNATTDMAGVYSVNIKIGDCLSSENDVIVEVATLPAFAVAAQGNTTICQGSSSNLSVNNRAGYSYAWQKDGAPISGAANSPAFTASETGIYSVVVTNNTTLCTTTTNEISLLVVDPPIAAFTLSSNNICLGEQITATNTSTVDDNATVQYLWDFGNGVTSPDVSPVIDFTEEGDYNISVEVSYSGVAGCTSSIQHTVTVNVPVAAEIIADGMDICPEEELELSVNGEFTEINWSTGTDGNSILVNSPGNYTVSTIDNNGCTSTDDFIVGAKALPALNITASTANIPITEDTIRVNTGDLVFLNATGADTYLWNPEEPLNDATLANPELIVSDAMLFIVTGTMTGGCSAIDSIFIAINTGEGLPINPNKVFAPESSTNPTWEIDLSFLNESCQLAIFDERGRKVIEQNGNLFIWDGTSAGKAVPEGVYYYVVGCPSQGKKAGTVLVVRR